MNLSKNSSVIGTWDDLAFQLAIDESGQKKPEPLSISMVDMYGFHCIPHVGVYGDDYTPCIPFLLLDLPAQPLLDSNAVPEDLIKQIDKWDIFEINSHRLKAGYKAEFYVLVHTLPLLSPCQKFLCNNMDEVNMMYHPWLFGSTPLTEDLSITKNLTMGLFEATNIKPVHQNLKDAGISFGYAEDRSVALHGLRFSPENAQFQLELSKGEIASFFALAFDQESSRFVLSFHVLPLIESVESRLANAVHSSNTTQELVTNLSQVDSSIGSKLHSLLSSLTVTAPNHPS